MVNSGFRILSWGVLFTAVLTGAVLLLLQSLEMPPLLDRESPEYAARFAEAAKLNEINPGLSPESLTNIRAQTATTVANLRADYPDVSEAEIAQVEAIVAEGVERMIEIMRSRFQHFWATNFTVDELRYMREPDELPYLSRLRIRLKLWWTSRQQQMLVAQTNARLKSETDAVMQEVIVETYLILNSGNSDRN